MNEIYECVPRGYEGPPNLLRSIPHPRTKAFVRFLNTTNTPVSVKWIDFYGKLKQYRILSENHFFDCDTFVDHAWVFKDYSTNDPMCVENKEVFWPQAHFSTVNGIPVQERRTVKIHRPVLPLKTLAARVIRNKLGDITEPFFLEIPFHLQTLLVKYLFEYWEEFLDKQSITPIELADDPANIILHSDFEDFQSNIRYISYRLAMHAKKLLSMAQTKCGGSGYTLIKTLEAIMFSLGYKHWVNYEMHTRKLAPIIWKQIIFLRVHLDTLGCALNSNLKHKQTPVNYYVNLKTVIERRLHLMLLMAEEHRKSVLRYHWEQLRLLLGDPEMEGIRKTKDPAYDIPELLPLDERKEWEWIDKRRQQFKSHPNQNCVNYYFDLTSHLLGVTNKLENIFQVLCCFHFHLTGRHITDEVYAGELEA